MSASMVPVGGSLSFRRIMDVPFETCVAALDSWQRTGHCELRVGESLLRGPVERDREAGYAGSRSAWPGDRCARCCA